VLGSEFDKPYMKQLQGFLEQEWGSQTIYPPQDSIFRAFNAVPFDQVRGQQAQEASTHTV
jgi:uracil-DNA glycosylase